MRTGSTQPWLKGTSGGPVGHNAIPCYRGGRRKITHGLKKNSMHLITAACHPTPCAPRHKQQEPARSGRSDQNSHCVKRCMTGPGRKIPQRPSIRHVTRAQEVVMERVQALRCVAAALAGRVDEADGVGVALGLADALVFKVRHVERQHPQPHARICRHPAQLSLSGDPRQGPEWLAPHTRNQSNVGTPCSDVMYNQARAS